MKKILSIAVVIVMMLSAFTAFAEETTPFFQTGDYNEDVVQLHVTVF